MSNSVFSVPFYFLFISSYSTDGLTDRQTDRQTVGYAHRGRCKKGRIMMSFADSCYCLYQLLRDPGRITTSEWQLMYTAAVAASTCVVSRLAIQRGT